MANSKNSKTIAKAPATKKVVQAKSKTVAKNKKSTKAKKKPAKVEILDRQTAPEKNTGYRNPIVPRRRANIVVTHENALQLSTCFACIRNISEDIAKLPWNVFARENTKRVKLDGSPLNRLLNTRANPEQGSFEFRRTLISWALSWGNGYAEIERDLANRPIALWPLSPDRCDPMRIDGEVWLRIYNWGQDETYLPPEDYLHLKGPSFDGIKGYSMIGLAAQSIGFSLAAEEHGASYYGNNTTLGTLFKMGTALEDEAYDRLKADIKERQGSKNAWEGLILEEGMDIASVATNQVDSQYLETRRFEVEEVCRFWRVPPHKVGELTNAHFRNVEQLNIAYATDCLQPWIKCLEEEADYKLISARNNAMYTRIALQGLMRGDSKARSDFYKAMHGIGVFSINRILEMEDMDPIGPEGDEHFMQSAMTTVKRIVDGTVAGQMPAPGSDNNNNNQNADENQGEGDNQDGDQNPADILKPAIRALALRFIHRDLKRAEAQRGKFNYNDAGFANWLEKHHAKEKTLRENALTDLLVPAAAAFGDHIDPVDILTTYEICANQELQAFHQGKTPNLDFICNEFLRAFTDGTEN